MSEQGNRDYYRRRQRQEEAAVDAATDPAARTIHQQLADCYEARAGVLHAVEAEPRLDQAAA